MTDVALIFPGQGAQQVGMGQGFYETSAEAKAIFDQANDVVGGLADVMFNGPQEKLTETAYCQPAILTMSMAALAAFKVSAPFKNLNVRFTAGLSLGEYSALVAAGNVSFQDGVRLVKARSTFMEEAGSQSVGAMAAVIGMDKTKLVDICASAGAEVANFNSPDQIVITGHKDNVEAASALIKEAGAKRVIALDVSGAFHSSLMQPAADQFVESLNGIEFLASSIQTISNVDGKPEVEVAHIRTNLAKQITSSVQWVASVEYMVAQGVTEFIEIGPGNVLKGLVRKINPDVRVQNIATPEDIATISF